MASDPQTPCIRLPLLLWRQTLGQLRRRGAGERESGAFLLGRQQGAPKITKFLCYDELDPDAYQHGAIAFHAAGYAALWAYCKAKKLQVLADVHTHPSGNVLQSFIDQKNPMIPVTGHTAMIVPNYGRASSWSLMGVGVYEYRGDFKWRECSLDGKSPRIRLTAW